MTAAVLDRIVARVIYREGAVADVGDGQGVTRWGQTPAWLLQWQLPVPTTMDDAAANYRAWLARTRLDALCELADALPDVVVDFAVHSGERVAIRALQTAIGAPADGVIGPVTIAALARCNRRQASHDVMATRVAYLGQVLASQPSAARYARGWFARVAQQIRELDTEAIA